MDHVQFIEEHLLKILFKKFEIEDKKNEIKDKERVDL